MAIEGRAAGRTKRSNFLNRMQKNILLLSFLSIILLTGGCARHRVSSERPSPSHGMKGVYHIVERHQTLYRICKTYGVDLKEVASLNGIADPGKIETGQRIFIAGAKKVLKVEIYIDDVAAEQGEKSKITYKKLDFIWPVEGRITDVFKEAESKKHQGIDISSPIGTPIRASNAGKERLRQRLPRPPHLQRPHQPSALPSLAPRKRPKQPHRRKDHQRPQHHRQHDLQQRKSPARSLSHCPPPPSFRM